MFFFGEGGKASAGPVIVSAAEMARSAVSLASVAVGCQGLRPTAETVGRRGKQASHSIDERQIIIIMFVFFRVHRDRLIQ